MNKLQTAIKQVGGQGKLAAAIVEYRKSRGFDCNVRQQHVWKWLNHQSGNPQVPPEYCVAIEEIVNGAVTRYELRPDVFGAAPNDEQEAA